MERHRQLVRLPALLHDVGHSPFSHASEELFPDQEDGNGKYGHEQYSAAIVRGPLRSAIEDHKLNHANCGFTADNVADLIEGGAGAKQGIFWRDLISSQMDADRMDYLSRDAYHAGVQYGRFDLHRLISTVTALETGEGKVRLGIEEGGLHAAEGLVLARYFMFTQVYFHKTRSAYDIHVREALRELLPGGQFPSPGDLNNYMAWEDWRVLGLLSNGGGGEHGRRLCDRDHYRLVYQTSEVQSEKDREKLQAAREALGDLLAGEVPAAKSWYKTGVTDIAVIEEQSRRTRPLSEFSKVVKSLGANNQVLLYSRPEDRREARSRLKGIVDGLE
ncbi:MAG: HD domain-containing protein [Bryobacteraceae bacterium]